MQMIIIIISVIVPLKIMLSNRKLLLSCLVSELTNCSVWKKFISSSNYRDKILTKLQGSMKVLFVER